MKESYREGLTNHPGPEPCEGKREAALEALDRGNCRLGIELRNSVFQEADGVGRSRRQYGRCESVSTGLVLRSRRPQACRETPCARTGRPRSRPRVVRGPEGERDEHKSFVHGGGESYSGVVPTKQPNQGEGSLAEVVEGRPLTKENTQQPNSCRTASRESERKGLARVREAAKQNGKLKFTALLHQVSIDLLRDSYYSLQKKAAPGVDGGRGKTMEKSWRHA